jgi:SAM-dependent methyltransferase
VRLRSILEHPLTRGLDIDDPTTTTVRRSVIAGKPFLLDVYRDWYHSLAEAVPQGPGAVLELGSGAGFLSSSLPGLITSEVFFCHFVKAILDAQALPFAAKSLRGIVMTNVMHHIPRPHDFLRDASLCLRRDGVIAMVEPWVSPWSKVVYRKLHHEPFVTDAEPVLDDVAGPLSGANGALPWILFQRDRVAFDRQWPQWRLETVRPMTPFRYLVSGGVSMRSFMPGWATSMWRNIERAVDLDRWAMFALIVLRRTGQT